VIPFKQVKVQRSERRERWIALRRTNPLAPRSELQSLDPTCFSWLYLNEPDWLRENFPARKKPRSPWQLKRLQNGKWCDTIAFNTASNSIGPVFSWSLIRLS